MQEKFITHFSICFFRIFTLAFGGGAFFFGLMLLTHTPLAILFLLVGLFILRLFIRIVRPIEYNENAIIYQSLFGKHEICISQIRYARIWQANYINMLEKNVIIVLPGFFNFYYMLNTKENKLVHNLNQHNIEKRSMLFTSESHIE